jgi:hypothetical protein
VPYNGDNLTAVLCHQLAPSCGTWLAAAWVDEIAAVHNSIKCMALPNGS